MQEGAPPGTCHPDPASQAHMSQAVSEAALYRQLTHFHRQLDVPSALLRARGAMKVSLPASATLRVRTGADKPPPTQLQPHATISGALSEGCQGKLLEHLAIEGPVQCFLSAEPNMLCRLRQGRQRSCGCSPSGAR